MSDKKQTKDEVKESEKVLKEKSEKTEADLVKKQEEAKEDLKDSEVTDIDSLDKNTKDKTEKTEKKAPKKDKTSVEYLMAKKKKKKIRKYIILGVIVVLLIAGYFYIKKTIENAKALVEAMTNNVQTTEVEKKTLLDTVPATGTLVPVESVTLSTILQSSSKIEEVNVAVGDYVEKDEVLVRFSTEDINKQINQTREDISSQRQKDAISAEDSERQYVNSYVTATNSLRTASERVDKALKSLHEACNEYGEAKRTLEKDREKYNYDEENPTVKSDRATVDAAFKKQESAQQAYDEAVEAQAEAISNQENNLSTADSTYKTSNLSRGDAVKNSTRQLEKLEDSLDNYIVTASISGIVTAVNVSEGNSFSNGSVLTIQDISTMEVEVLVDEYDIPKVKAAYERAASKGENLGVEIKTNATDENLYKGHVVMIDPTSTATASFTTAATSNSSMSSAASSASSSPQYKVKVQLDEMDDAFMIGMTAKVSIVVDQSPENSLCVPYNAIEEKENGELFVNVVENSKKNDDSEAKEDGIVVENNTTQKGKKDGTPNGAFGADYMSQLKDARNMKDATKVIEDSKPKTHEVRVKKVFETDYYVAIEPINPNELKEGDEVTINDDRNGSSNDFMNMMMSGPGGRY